MLRTSSHGVLGGSPPPPTPPLPAQNIWPSPQPFQATRFLPVQFRSIQLEISNVYLRAQKSEANTKYVEIPLFIRLGTKWL